MRNVIIWDWNGTLLDDTAAALATLNIMLARRGKPPIEMPFYKQTFAFPVRPFYEAIGMVLENEDWDALAKEYHDTYHEQPKTLAADAVAAIDDARRAGCKQGILSALRQDLLERDTARFGIADKMDFLAGVDNLDGASKLDRAKRLIAKLRSEYPDGTRFVMIGDALHDKEVADAIGVEVRLYSGGSHAGERLAKAGPVYDTLRDAVAGLGGKVSLGALFWSFMKMGAVLIGGGYALLPLLEREIVTRRQWAKSEEMLDLYALAQLLPGVIAVNTAMLVGNRLRGFAGTLVAAAGLTLVPFALIAAYAAAYGALSGTEVFSKALTGVQSAVAGMILALGFDMIRKTAKTKGALFLAIGSALVMALFDPSFVWLVVFALVAGLGLQAANLRRDDGRKQNRAAGNLTRREDISQDEISGERSYRAFKRHDDGR